MEIMTQPKSRKSIAKCWRALSTRTDSCSVAVSAQEIKKASLKVKVTRDVETNNVYVFIKGHQNKL